MKTTSQHFRRDKKAFTLIELLVVIAIIGLLAGLIVSLAGNANRSAKLKRVQVELKNVETIIRNYKDKKGFYPPDNPINAAKPPLFYELTGTTYTPPSGPFKSIKGNITTNQVGLVFNISGFVNTTADPVENPVFSYNFSPSQYAEDPANVGVQFLVCPVEGPGGTFNPWSYNSSNPTNNPGTFDLWVDVVLGKKTNRICNWSSTPIPL